MSPKVLHLRQVSKVGKKSPLGCARSSPMMIGKGEMICLDWLNLRSLK